MKQAQRQKASIVVAPVAKTNTATASGLIDCKGAKYGVFLVALSAELNTDAVGPTLSVSAGDTSTAFTTIVADRTDEDCTAAKVVAYHVDLRSQKRYVKVAVTTATATNDNITVGCVALLADNEQEVGGTTGMANVVVKV